MHTDKRIDTFVYLFGAAVLLFVIGLTIAADARTPTIGVLLAVAGVVLGVAAYILLQRSKRAKHAPPPTHVGHGRKGKHKGAK